MSLVTALRARCHANTLDAALAAGARPEDSAELAARARHLTSLSFRSSLATRLENAVRYPHAARREGGISFSAAVNVPAALAEHAAPTVLALARDLRATPGPRPAGVALTLRLMTDGSSPLYCGPTVEDLVRSVEEAREAL